MLITIMLVSIHWRLEHTQTTQNGASEKENIYTGPIRI